METSLFIAQLLGPILLVVALALLLNFKFYISVLNDFAKSPGLLYFAGLLTFLLGILIVRSHNLWAWEWYAIVTVFGWATLLKGILLILLPEWMIEQTKYWKKNANYMKGWAWILLVISAYLCYMAYWA